jgi:ABC-type uncharacterized transport system permease subunit
MAGSILAGFLSAGIALGTPILLAALGELLVERAGVLNIGLEGMMLLGAFAGAVAANATGSASAGVAAAAAIGMVAGAAFALTAVWFSADQIIVGTAINLIALGATGTLYRALFGDTGTALVLPPLPPLPIPGLVQLPLVGEALFGQHALVDAALVLTPAIALALSRTGLGLRIRALGDHPLAAASLGFSVRRDRTAILVVGGLLAGLSGAALSLATAGSFVEGVTNGRGFVALAVVVFGRWSAWGVLGGALLFGFASALQFQFQALGAGVPYQLFLMLPYVLTLLALLVPAGRSGAPRALGARYERD